MYVFVVVPQATVTKQGLVLYIYVSLDLDEDWYHSEDPVNAGVTFFVKVCARLSTILQTRYLISLGNALTSDHIYM